jgi:hypothetical protein
MARTFILSAGILIVSLAAAEQASAGCCLPGVPVCVCPVRAPEIYVVEQGPIFTGPGPCLRQPSDPPPAGYPYVGHIYTGYPYGEFGPGGYPRGFYSPYLGYPYAEPSPPVVCGRHYGRRYSSRRAHRGAVYAR